jgi:hypothetical protein
VHYQAYLAEFLSTRKLANKSSRAQIRYLRTLMMGAECSTETSVNLNATRGRYTPDDGTLHTCYRFKQKREKTKRRQWIYACHAPTMSRLLVPWIRTHLPLHLLINIHRLKKTCTLILRAFEVFDVFTAVTMKNAAGTSVHIPQDGILR